MGAVKIVAYLWCDLSKPLQEGHFFNQKIIRSIRLTSLEKKKKIQICSKCWNLHFGQRLRSIWIFLKTAKSDWLNSFSIIKKCPSRTGFDRSHHRSKTILMWPIFGGFGFFLVQLTFYSVFMQGKQKPSTAFTAVTSQQMSRIEGLSSSARGLQMGIFCSSYSNFVSNWAYQTTRFIQDV